MHMIRKGIRSTNKPTVKNEIMNQELENVNQNWIHLNTLQIENTMQVGVTTIAFEELKGIIATDLSPVKYHNNPYSLKAVNQP